MSQDFVDLLRAFNDHEVRYLVFADAWPDRIEGPFGPVSVSFIGRDAYIRNKRATGPAKDLGDVESLG